MAFTGVTNAHGPSSQPTACRSPSCSPMTAKGSSKALGKLIYLHILNRLSSGSWDILQSFRWADWKVRLEAVDHACCRNTGAVFLSLPAAGPCSTCCTSGQSRWDNLKWTLCVKSLVIRVSWITEHSGYSIRVSSLTTLYLTKEENVLMLFVGMKISSLIQTS